MQPEWYFVRDGERVGPRAADEVQALFSAGVLAPETLVWTAGMEQWRPAFELPEFAHVLRGVASPPPIPDPTFQHRQFTSGTATAAGPPHTEVYARVHPPLQTAEEVDSSPHAWRRWTARMIDVGCVGFVFGVLLELLAPGSTAELNDVAANVIVFALCFPVEAVVLSAFGTTVGKRLLRIRVVRRDGLPLDFGTALNRSFQVWMSGLGFGIPLVSLVTMVVGYNRLTSEGRTSWDSALQLSVHHGRISAVRWLIVAACILTLIAAAVYGAASA